MRSFKTPELNEIEEVKEARAKVWELCEPILESNLFKSNDESILRDNLERWKVDIYNQKLLEQQKKIEEGSDSSSFIPESGKFRGVPNVFLRSALFSIDKPSKYDKSRDIELSIIPCQSPYKMLFKGYKLTQNDLDVWLSLIHLAGGIRFGEEFDFSISDLLAACNKTRTGPNANLVLESLEKLSRSSIEILELAKDKKTVKSILYHGLLIEKFRIDDSYRKHKRYHVAFSEDMSNLYKYDSYLLLDWEARQKINGKFLAQWLHAFFSSHATVFDLSITYIHALCGSKCQQQWRFKQTLKNSLDELFLVFNIFGYGIKDRKKINDVDRHIPVSEQLLRIRKEGSEAQKSHLFKKEMSQKVQSNPDEQ